MNNSGALTIGGTLLENNAAGAGGQGGQGDVGGDGGFGGTAGAIVHRPGSVTIDKSIVRGNRGGAMGPGGSGTVRDGLAGEMGAVGGVESLPVEDGDLTILDSTFEANVGGETGAVSHSSGSFQLTIRRSLFRANQGDEYAGGVTNRLSLAVIQDSRFEQNVGAAGGIYNDRSALSLVASALINNQGTSSGGGIYNRNSLGMTITDSLIADNRLHSCQQHCANRRGRYSCRDARKHESEELDRHRQSSSLRQGSFEKPN